jgi:hypothetical protein
MGVSTTDKTWARDGRGSQGGSIDDRSDGLKVKRILLSASCTFASFDRSISIRNLLPTPAPAPAPLPLNPGPGCDFPLPLLPSPGCYFRFPEAKRAKVVTVLSPPFLSLCLGLQLCRGIPSSLSFFSRAITSSIIIIMYASSLDVSKIDRDLPTT